MVQGYKDGWRCPRQNHGAKAVKAPELSNPLFGYKRHIKSVTTRKVPSVGNPINYTEDEGDVCMTRFVDESYEKRCNDQSKSNTKQVVLLVANFAGDEALESHGEKSDRS